MVAIKTNETRFKSNKVQVDRITWGKLSQAFPEIRVGHFIVATVYCTQLENNSVRHLHMNLGPGKSGLSKTRR